jgi:zinc protease
MRVSLLVVTLLGASCGSTPPPREYPRLPETETREAILEPAREPLRDAPLVIVERSATPIITFRIVFDAGSAADEPGREGITNLTARVMVEGGAGDLTYAQLSERLYPMAGDIASYVGRDETVFIGQAHRDHLEAFYDLFRDVLVRPRMGEADFARVRDQVENELTIDLRSASDEDLGKEALQSMLYAGHPYEHPPLGTEAGLARLRVDDLRAHRDRVFCAGRMTIGITGDVPTGFETGVARDLGVLRSEACVGRAVLPAPRVIDAPRVLIIDKPEAQAVAVSMGFPIEVRRDHPDYPALVLAAAWLGQHRQFVGRLMQSIRGARGLNYGDYAYSEHFTQEGWGRFPLVNDARRQQYFSVWLRPLRPDAAHFAVRLAVRELRRFVSEGLPEAELDRIRTFADAYFALYLQTSSRRLGYSMDDAFYGIDEPYLERLRAAWRALTVDQLNDAIRRHLTIDRLQIALVAANAEALADAIASERESPITYPSNVPETVTTEDREIVAYRLGIPRDHIEVVPLARLFAE